VADRVLLASWRRPELFDDDSPYSLDVRAMQREWELLQARYEHLPEFKELLRHYLADD
jgi:hypothetical protein